MTSTPDEHVSEELRVCSRDKNTLDTFLNAIRSVLHGGIFPARRTRTTTRAKATAGTESTHHVDDLPDPRVPIKQDHLIKSQVWKYRNGDRSEAQCPICGDKIYHDLGYSFHRAHIIPNAHYPEEERSDLTYLDNYLTTCAGCNRAMGSMHLYVYANIKDLRGKKLGEVKKHLFRDENLVYRMIARKYVDAMKKLERKASHESSEDVHRRHVMIDRLDSSLMRGDYNLFMDTIDEIGKL